MVAWKDSEKVRGGKYDPKRKKSAKKGPKDKGDRKIDNDIQEAIQDGLDELDLYEDEEDEPDGIPDEGETKDLSAKTPFFIGRTHFCTTNLRISYFFGKETYALCSSGNQDYHNIVHF